jgi:hypothetical protein
VAAEGPLVVVRLIDDAEGEVGEERLPVLQAEAQRNRVNDDPSIQTGISALQIAKCAVSCEQKFGKT